jgi:hypothetical protein
MLAFATYRDARCSEYLCGKAPTTVAGSVALVPLRASFATRIPAILRAGILFCQGPDLPSVISVQRFNYGVTAHEQ